MPGYIPCNYMINFIIAEAEYNIVSLEYLLNSNMSKDTFLEYMGWKEAIFDRLKASNNNKVEYGIFIPTPRSIFYKQTKGWKDMLCVLINNQ